MKKKLNKLFGLKKMFFLFYLFIYFVSCLLMFVQEKRVKIENKNKNNKKSLFPQFSIQAYENREQDKNEK